MSDGPLITDNARDFGAALPEGGALLALDLGTKTIGTALCDAGWRFAVDSPYPAAAELTTDVYA